MKVLLVNPPLRRLVSANVPAFVERERGTYPPIGLLSIAAYLRERGPRGTEVLVLDAAQHDCSDGRIEEFIRREAPDIVGVQALTFTLLDSLAVVQAAKRVNPATTTVMGGRHCDLYPLETLSLPGVDFVVKGDGEITMARLVEHLGDPRRLEEVPGLAFRAAAQVVDNPGVPIEDLDDLPFPARELTAYRDYRFPLSKRPVFTTLITSRGCPYACTFCDEGHTTFRAHSAQRVVEEILDCKRRLGIDQFFIFDSTFTVDRQRVLDICRLLVERDAGITFDIRSRVDLMDDELLSALKQAGCIRIQYGVESGNDVVLAGIGKKIDVALVRDVIRRTRRHGFEILCDFMIGLPGETAEAAEDTIRLALELPLDYAQFSITVPYPGTRLYDRGMRMGLFGDYWRQFSRSPSEDFQPRVWGERLDRGQLMALTRKAYERFYFRPSHLLRELGRVRGLTELRQKLGAGWRLLVGARQGRG